MDIYQMQTGAGPDCGWSPTSAHVEHVWERHGKANAAAGVWVPLTGCLDGDCADVDFPAWIDPVFSGRARDATADLLDPFGEWLPLETEGGHDFFLYNVLTVVDWLDVDRSSVERFDDGTLMAVDRFEFLIDSVDPSVHCFQLADYWSNRVFVSGDLVERVSSNSLMGAKFRRLWSAESGGRPLGFPW